MQAPPQKRACGDEKGSKSSYVLIVWTCVKCMQSTKNTKLNNICLLKPYMKSSNRMHSIRVFKFPVTPEVSHDRVIFLNRLVIVQQSSGTDPIEGWSVDFLWWDHAACQYSQGRSIEFLVYWDSKGGDIYDSPTERQTGTFFEVYVCQDTLKRQARHGFQQRNSSWVHCRCQTLLTLWEQTQQVWIGQVTAEKWKTLGTENMSKMPRISIGSVGRRRKKYRRTCYEYCDVVKHQSTKLVWQIVASRSCSTPGTRIAAHVL